MKITLLYFAHAAEAAGRDREDVELPSGTSAGDALAEARRLHPALAAAGFAPLLAVNRTWSEAARPLADGDEVAVLPPVSGG